MTEVLLTTFTPKFSALKQIPGTVPTSVIIDETMVHSASPDFAYTYGGPLTRAVLDAMPELPKPPAGHYHVVDTRVHMLMPEMMPAIPGWHCDAVPRASFHSQPDVGKLDELGHIHRVVTLSDHVQGVSNTQFLVEPITIPVVPYEVWGSVNEHVERRAHELHPKGYYNVPDGTILEFTRPTLHRGMPAHNRGWRFWLRLSVYYAPPKPAIRKQVQVYATYKGW